MQNRPCVRSFLSRVAEFTSLRATDHMTRLMRMLRGKMLSFFVFWHADMSGCTKCVFVRLMWETLACIDGISYLRRVVALRCSWQFNSAVFVFICFLSLYWVVSGLYQNQPLVSAWHGCKLLYFNIVIDASARVSLQLLHSAVTWSAACRGM